MLNFIKSYKKNQLKKMGLTEQEAEQREIRIQPPKIRWFCCLKKALPEASLIEREINKLEKRIEKEREQLDVDKGKDLFVGSAFLTVENQRDLVYIVDSFNVNLFKRFINFILLTILRIKR